MTSFRKKFVSVCDAVGVLQVWRKRNRCAPAILMFHGTPSGNSDNSWKPLRDQFEFDSFKRVIELLAPHHSFLSMNDALKVINGQLQPEKQGIVITFDDGYRNVLENAAPYLVERGIPMTIYLSTWHLESGEPFWFDRLDYLFQQANSNCEEIRLARKNFTLDMRSRSALKESYSELRRFIKSTDDDVTMIREVETVASSLEKKYGRALKDKLSGDSWAALISISDLKKHKNSKNIEFGSHMVHHYRAVALATEDLNSELVSSKVTIEGFTSKQCLHFAYPNGEYNKATERSVREAGYVTAVTDDQGVNPIGSNLLALKRVSLTADLSKSEILSQVSGFSQFLARARHRLALKK